MWRLILVTFAFLGWSFYELSGGSEYQPRVNSLQAQAAIKRAEVAMAQAEQPATQPQQVETVQDDTAVVTRAAASLSDLNLSEDTGRFRITLASASVDDGAIDTQVPTVRAQPVVANANAAIEAAIGEAIEAAATDEPEVFSLETYVNGQTGSVVAASSAGDGMDIRKVTGKVVNMRSGPGTEFDKLGRLKQGAEVIVLDEPGNGWVMLEVVSTGESGWMADWLVTASN